MTAFTHALRRKPVRRMAAVGIVAAGALVLSACSDNGDDMSGMDHGSGNSSAKATATAPAESGSFNDADVTFAQMMIPHHEQAVEMARLADGRASDSEVKDLASKIEAAQGPEIKTMTGWLTAWNKPTAMESMPGMDHSGMNGMMSDGDMKELKAMKGTEFDKMFAQMMIDHHNGAISMAKTEQTDGKNADAKKMAGGIVTSQSAEVKQLQSILDRL
ncbi:DUF305 domain-containing protein [Streptomyces sp. NPDC049627]|uniref:DUF305 domain-containing protein n=1 Tax=Streptomyces sp. NPDC049627 TaxID=3365595 RepID=UPI0037A76CCB